ncbi:MAG: HDOD domain-containing protein [Deltaproteobacteria bacterium]|nr:HDOD domain-containing protein [Deltaproteobacteria bacterium]
MRGPAAPPSLPAAVARLLSVCARDEYSLAELVSTVEGDPGIASRLLRLANSAYYGLHRQVGDLERAALVLGRTTVQAVALGATLLELWRDRPLPARAEDLWVHAYLCGMGCRHLARRLPSSPWRSEAEALFLAGLLHDLGKLLFLAREPEPYLEALEQLADRPSLRTWERDHFGADHAEAGAEALEAWSLPAHVIEVVRHHHAGGLRAELRPDWEVLRAVDDLLIGEPRDEDEEAPPEGLMVDLATHLESARAEAQAFYQAIA